MRRVAALFAAALVAAPAATARTEFFPNDPLASRQWYLDADRAFDAWPDVPALTPVKVAVIDSGIDGDHPEFAGKIALAQTFVGGSPYVDRQGHGTFVAGMIAAATNNGEGIAGIAFPAQLLIGKIVAADGTISISAEASAIRWAVDHGARVINLSIGGVRDPLHPSRDTFSQLEADAVAYAYKKGAVLVAAVGNSDQAPSSPWDFASYPAALPHVVGVSALSPSGNVPTFSNRDTIYNDMAAPGMEIFSTFPRQLTALRPSCALQGYSDCASEDYRHAEGTSFAAPQVSAAAALLFSVNPELRPDQVMTILERSADDVSATTGCRQCRVLRDSLSGWGRLDISNAVAALQKPFPQADRYEPNDDAGSRAVTVSGTRIKATLDYWDDQIDVYRVRIGARQRLVVRAQGPPAATSKLLLWKPGTKTVVGSSAQKLRAAQSVGSGPAQRLSYRAKRGGTYYLEIKLATPGAGAYTLSFSKR